MRLSTRKVLDRGFTLVGALSIVLMALSLVIILTPIIFKGAHAVVFRATIEHRQLQLEQFGNGDLQELQAELQQSQKALEPVFEAMRTFEEEELPEVRGRKRWELNNEYEEFRMRLSHLIGPLPGSKDPVLIRDQYGQTRWNRAKLALRDVLYAERWEARFDDEGNPLPSEHTLVPREPMFEDTSLAPVFPYLQDHLRDIMQPDLTFYTGFFLQESMDAHFFGGIWPEILGTFYLTIGAMLFSVPIGILSAIFLVEYTGQTGPLMSALISLIRTCISTLAGVPSIVFGLFGLAFFINTVHVSDNKSVLAGSLTLALLVLPTVIRASEEAIKAVPQTYKEAALSVGASKWHTIMTVILPAALPGILTGIVISMGRAAGETAPIIFTAAVSMGQPLAPLEVFNEGSPALSWNIYNLATEHEAVEQIRHVQYGMVMTLVVLVLLLNLAAILLRARISRKLKG